MRADRSCATLLMFVAEIGMEVAARIKQKGETMESVEEVAQ